jgi:ferric-dicitrate binding protein FerR (iron transport regulator)
MIDDVEYRRIARHFAGEEASDERAATEAWLNELPERRVAAEQLFALWRASAQPSWVPDADAAWTRVATRLHVGDAQSPLALVPPRASSMPRRSNRFAWRGVSSNRVMAPLIGASFAAAALLLFVASRTRSSNMGTVSSTPATGAPREYRTERGQRGVVAIGDDSRVELGAESVLRVSEVDSTGRRVLELEGEAVFDVVHDPTRRFEVRAGNAITEDLGTRFTVRAYRGERRVEVFVVSGTVALRAVDAPSTSGTILGPRDLGMLDTVGRTTVRNNVDSTSHVAWTRDRFVYENAPLRDVLRDVARWFDVTITTPDVDNLDHRITLNVSARSLSDVLGAITTPLRLHAKRNGRRIEIDE